MLATTGTSIAFADQEQPAPPGLLDALGKLFPIKTQAATAEPAKPAAAAQNQAGFDLTASATDLVPSKVVEFVLKRPPEGGECAIEIDYGDGST